MERFLPIAGLLAISLALFFLAAGAQAWACYRVPPHIYLERLEPELRWRVRAGTICASEMQLMNPTQMQGNVRGIVSLRSMVIAERPTHGIVGLYPIENRFAYQAAEQFVGADKFTLKISYDINGVVDERNVIVDVDVFGSSEPSPADRKPDAAPSSPSPSALAKQTVIEFSYDRTADELRPNPRREATARLEYNVVLSNDNKVTETLVRTSGAATDNKAMETALGQKNADVVWRVASGNRLIRVEEGPQQTETVVIALTPPDRCRAAVKFKLKPGFGEYAFPAIPNKEIGYFSNPLVHNVSCAIH